MSTTARWHLAVGSYSSSLSSSWPDFQTVNDRSVCWPLFESRFLELFEVDEARVEALFYDDEELYWNLRYSGSASSLSPGKDHEDSS